MRIHTLVLVVAASSAPFAGAQEQNPCTVLGLQGTFDRIGGTLGCVGGRTSGTFSADNTELSLRLAAVSVSEIRALTAEIKGLRSEMSAYRAALAQAKSGFDEATKATITGQEAWRQKALEQTLKDVQQIPARLALDDGLRQALLLTLKEDLQKDPTFIEAIREAAKP
jgi:hypothetical protein